MRLISSGNGIGLLARGLQRCSGDAHAQRVLGHKMDNATQKPRTSLWRVLAVAALPLLALCMGAAAEDSAELTGGDGHQQFVSGCSNEQHYTGDYGLAGARYAHKFENTQSSLQLGYEASGAVQRNDGTLLTDHRADPNTKAVATTTSEHKIERLAATRALFTVNHRYFGAGLGPTLLYRDHDSPSFTTAGLSVAPAATARLGEENLCIHGDLLNGGLSNSPQSFASAWAEYHTQAAPGEIQLDAMLGAELSGNSKNSPLYTAGLRAHINDLALQLVAAHAWQLSTTLPDYAVSIGLGWTLRTAAPPPAHSALPPEPTALPLAATASDAPR